ncbi:MAG: TolC family protein [Bacteroidaceae bacterium]
MKRILFIITLVWVSTAKSQLGMVEVLKQIEQNSTTLKAMREDLTAQKLSNHTGLTLKNPELEFGYLWGSPSPIGHRTDFALSQSFDFATLLGTKQKVARSRDEADELQYAVARSAYLLRAKQLCIDVLFSKEQIRLLEVRLEQMNDLLRLYDKRMTQGDANAFELNKAKQNSRLARAELLSIKAESEQVYAELRCLNGGVDLELETLSYREELLAPNFLVWQQEAERRNPMLAYLNRKAEVRQREMKLVKAEGLPSLTASYSQEKVVGERYSGIKLGVSIPLWENKNRVRQARASIVALRAQEADERIQLSTSLEALYRKAQAQKQVMDEYHAAYVENHTASLLCKAFTAGQISLIDYLRELDVYYELQTKAATSTRDYRKTLAEMKAYEL